MADNVLQVSFTKKKKKIHGNVRSFGNQSLLCPLGVCVFIEVHVLRQVFVSCVRLHQLTLPYLFWDVTILWVNNNVSTVKKDFIL